MRRALALLAALLAPGPLAAQPAVPAPAPPAVPAPPAAPAPPAPIVADWPRLQPARSARGMVVSQEALATRVGVEVLERGGSAVDAAVAVGFALAVTLPRAGNLGGGGFLLLRRADGAATAIDYRETAPAATTPDVFLDARGEADPARSRDSGLGVGVPGTVAGLALALDRHGSGRFTLAELIAPAVRLAREGFAVGDDLAASLRAAAPRLARHPSSAVFRRADGAPLEVGDTLRQPDLAATLEAIAAGGPRAFYEGRIAEAVAAAVAGAGGRMTPADLAAYRAVERAPVRGTYRGFEVLSMPPPSSGGVHLVQILNVLEGYDLAAMGGGSADAIHLMAEAMRLAYADRAEHLGDPDTVRVPVAGLTAKAYAARLRARIDPARARPSAEVRAGDPAPFEGDQTTHLSVVDAAGNAVSNTTTLNFSYGLGLVAPGTGVLLNNELDDFAAKPGAANAFGLTGGAANAPGPGRRPLSSMSPTILAREGRPFLVTGSPGGSRIITTVLNVVLGVVDHGLNVAEAVAAPRVHHQWLPDVLAVERGLSPDTLALLRARGHRIEVRPASGSASSILAEGGGWTGAADGRQQGTLAAGP